MFITRTVSDKASVQAPTNHRLFGDMDGLLNAVAQHVFATYVVGKAENDQTEDPLSDQALTWSSARRICRSPGFSAPIGTDLKHFHLITPYARDA